MHMKRHSTVKCKLKPQSDVISFLTSGLKLKRPQVQIRMSKKRSHVLLDRGGNATLWKKALKLN